METLSNFAFVYFEDEELTTLKFYGLDEYGLHSGETGTLHGEEEVYKEWVMHDYKKVVICHIKEVGGEVLTKPVVTIALTDKYNSDEEIDPEYALNSLSPEQIQSIYHEFIHYYGKKIYH